MGFVPINIRWFANFLIIASIMLVCTVLVMSMIPSGWQKIQARVSKVLEISKSGTDVQIVYAFGARQLTARINIPSQVSTNEIVVVEYNAYNPENVRNIRTLDRGKLVFFGLIISWMTLLTGVNILWLLGPR